MVPVTLVIIGYHWISLDIIGYHWISLDIIGYLSVQLAILDPHGTRCNGYIQGRKSFVIFLGLLPYFEEQIVELLDAWINNPVLLDFLFSPLAAASASRPRSKWVRSFRAGQQAGCVGLACGGHHGFVAGGA